MSLITVVAYSLAHQATIRLGIEGERIARCESQEPCSRGSQEDLHVAPAFWDLQTNGRWGVSFSDESLTVEQVGEIVRAHAGLGTARLCPTLITASFAATLHGVSTIAQACERWPEIDAMVLGIHLEGPWISERDGYRGAHPLEHVRDPDLGEFERWQAASSGRIRLVTLAPERLGAIPAIGALCREGVVVALGHTAADRATIDAACRAGARLSTHLGNGIADPLPRHPNPIWDQAAQQRLSASLIADGHHLGPSIVQVLVRAKGLDRIILVSDFSPLAGLPVGSYGAWAVDPSGKIVVTGTPYLAGANRGLDHGLSNLAAWAGLSVADVWSTVTTTPARLLGRDPPALAAGAPANLVLFRVLAEAERPIIQIERTCVDGRWFEPGASGV
jgi:N-acetylglucosamine-6-phosphate deacetylase